MKNVKLTITKYFRSIRSTLYQLIVCIVMFVLSDFGVIIWAAVRIKVQKSLSPIIVTFNLSINALTLMCSYADYRRRLFPFLKWVAPPSGGNPSRPGSLTKPGSLKRRDKKKLRKQRTQTFIHNDDDPRKEEGARKVAREEDEQKMAADEIFIYPNIFIKMPLSLAESLKSKGEDKLELPLKNRETGRVKSDGSKRVEGDKKFGSEEPCQSISVRTGRRENVRKWKFLEYVRRRPNLQEYETTV